jgi:hypothetical protein
MYEKRDERRTRSESVLAAGIVGEGRDGESGDEGGTTSHVEDAVLARVEDRSGGDGSDDGGETTESRGETAARTTDAGVEELGGDAVRVEGLVGEKAGREGKRTRKAAPRRETEPSTRAGSCRCRRRSSQPSRTGRDSFP